MAGEQRRSDLVYAALMGLFAGLAAKKTGRALAIGLGLAFAATQVSRYLAAQGAPGPGREADLARPVAPPPPALGAAMARVAAILDSDGDGVVSASDLASHGRRLCAFVGAPAGACVAGGFLLGLRQG